MPASKLWGYHPTGVNTLTGSTGVWQPVQVDANGIIQVYDAKALHTMDFWSDPVEEIVIPAVAGTLALPNVVVADLPVGVVVVRAYALVKIRIIENVNAGANALNGATVAGTSQVIQVRNAAPGAWADAINFVDNQFTIAAGPLRENGDVLIGSIDIAATVSANATYNLQYLLALADLASINWNDVQAGLRLYWR